MCCVDDPAEAYPAEELARLLRAALENHTVPRDLAAGLRATFPGILSVRVSLRLSIPSRAAQATLTSNSLREAGPIDYELGARDWGILQVPERPRSSLFAPPPAPTGASPARVDPAAEVPARRVSGPRGAASGAPARRAAGGGAPAPEPPRAALLTLVVPVPSPTGPRRERGAAVRCPDPASVPGACGPPRGEPIPRRLEDLDRSAARPHLTGRRSPSPLVASSASASSGGDVSPLDSSSPDSCAPRPLSGEASSRRAPPAAGEALVGTRAGPREPSAAGDALARGPPAYPSLSSLSIGGRVGDSARPGSREPSPRRRLAPSPTASRAPALPSRHSSPSRELSASARRPEADEADEADEAGEGSAPEEAPWPDEAGDEPSPPSHPLAHPDPMPNPGHGAAPAAEPPIAALLLSADHAGSFSASLRARAELLARHLAEGFEGAVEGIAEAFEVLSRSDGERVRHAP